MVSVGADASAALAVVGGVAGVGSAVVVGVVVLFGVVAIGVGLAAAAGVLTVVDVLMQASVDSGLAMVVGVELSSSKNFFVVAKCRE